MGSTLPTKKMDKHNYASWEYKMHQYLAGQGYWSYIEGAEEIAPDLIVPHEVARRQPGNVLLGNMWKPTNRVPPVGFRMSVGLSLLLAIPGLVPRVQERMAPIGLR